MAQDSAPSSSASSRPPQHTADRIKVQSCFSIEAPGRLSVWSTRVRSPPIRTACASAAATDKLARADARRLAILGTGEQAWQHALAIPYVRQIEHIAIWGRSTEKARHLCERLQEELAISVEVAPSPRAAVDTADIICTTTSARDPILFSTDVRDGAHINVVGSSYAGPAEIDETLVKRARFFPDHREGVPCARRRIPEGEGGRSSSPKPTFLRK